MTFEIVDYIFKIECFSCNIFDKVTIKRTSSKHCKKNSQ